MDNGLRMLIEESINPDSWYDLSTTTPPGQGQITLYPQMSMMGMTAPHKMAVYNTPEVHQKVNDLLDQLRKSLGHEVSLEARFLVVSQNFLQDIGLDLDFIYQPGGKWGVINFQQNSATQAAPDTSTKVPGSLGGLVDNPAANITGGLGHDAGPAAGQRAAAGHGRTQRCEIAVGSEGHGHERRRRVLRHYRSGRLTPCRPRSRARRPPPAAAPVRPQGACSTTSTPPGGQPALRSRRRSARTRSTSC